MPVARLLASVLVLALATQAPAPQTAGSFFPPDDAVRALVQPYIDTGQAKGIVVGLIEPDGSRRVLAFGDAGEGARPMAASSVFELGSLAKPFTGTVLADMVRRGEVKLDDPVGKYLPRDVRVPSLNGRQITLLDLATHRSGLPRLPTGYEPVDQKNPWAHYTAKDLYAFLNGFQLAHEPGSNFEYSNLGVGLLSHALARAAGADSFATLLADRVLRPLGMSMTGYGRPPAIAPWMTKGHDQKGAVAPYFDVDVLAGAGGLNANVTDMMTFLDANIGEPSSPLEHAMRDAHRGYYTRDTDQVGLGWVTQTRGPLTMVSHNGGSAGYSAFIVFEPTLRAGLVVLANTGGFRAHRVGRDLLNRDQRQGAGTIRFEL